jgi:hypothetical protein
MTLRATGVRAAWPVLAILAVAIPFGALVHDDSAGDSSLFFGAADVLLSHRFTHAFGDPSLQVGPLQLLLFGGGARLAHALGLGSATLLSVVIQAGAALLVVGTALLVLAGAPRRRTLAFAAGIATVATGLTLGAFDSGHPANLCVPLLWIVAGVAARRGNLAAAGALVGLGCGLEVWSLLGLPVLLLAPSLRGALRAALWTLAIVALLFGPFALGAHFRMLDYHWAVAGGTPVSLVLGAGTQFGWPLRLLQGALALGAATLVLRQTRRSLHAVWLVPLAIVLVRLLLDPQLHLYYFAEVAAPALVGAAALAGRQGRTPA